MREYKNFSDMAKDAPLSPELLAIAKELGRKTIEEIDVFMNPQNYEFAVDIKNDLILYRKRPSFDAPDSPKTTKNVENIEKTSGKGIA